MDVHIGALWRKGDRYFPLSLIMTVRGAGSMPEVSAQLALSHDREPIVV
jgi:hypothetical protein